MLAERPREAITVPGPRRSAAEQPAEGAAPNELGRHVEAETRSWMEPLDLLLDESGGDSLPLPPELLAFYGPLRLAGRADRPRVFANFVASVDGIVAVGPPGKNGAAISGGNAHD